MKTLSEADDDELPALLSPLVDAYEAWIERPGAPARRARGAHKQAAREHSEGRRAKRRAACAPGIAALAVPDVADAFRFANHAMWQQRVHTLAGRGAPADDPALRLHRALDRADIPKNRSWRPFQLAFVLLNLPALADPRHAERTSAAARGPAVLPHRRRQDRGLSRADRVRARDPTPAGRRRRPRRAATAWRC